MAIRVTCTNCGAAYKIDESKIPATGGAIKCQGCGTRFAVMRPPIEPNDATGDATVIGKAPQMPVAPRPQPMANDPTPTVPNRAAPVDEPLFTAASIPLGGETPLGREHGDAFDSDKTQVGFSMPMTAPSATDTTDPRVPIALGGTGAPPAAIALGGTGAPPAAIALGGTGAPPAAIALGGTGAPPAAIALGGTSAPPAAIALGGTSAPPAAIALGGTGAPPAAIALGGANGPLRQEATNPGFKVPSGIAETTTNPAIKLGGDTTNPGVKAASLRDAKPFASMGDEPTNPTGRTPAAIALPSADDVMSDDSPIQLTDDDDIFSVDDSAETQVGPRPSQPLDLPLDLPTPALDLPEPAAQPLNLSTPLDLPAPLDLAEEDRDRAADFDDLPAPVMGGTPEPTDLPDFDGGATVVAQRPPQEQFSGITLEGPPSDLPRHVSAPPEDLPRHVSAPPEDLPRHVSAPPEDLPRHVSAPPEDLPRPLSALPDDLPTQLDDGVPEPLEASIPEPAPSLGIDQMPEPLDVAGPMAVDDFGGPVSADSLSEPLEEQFSTPTKSNRRWLLLVGFLGLMAAGAVAASYFMTGLLPWELLNPSPAPPPQVASAPVLAPIPPAPDLAAIESKDLSAYTQALAVLDERKAARKARGQSDADKEDDPARAKLLWHGAMLLGSKALAEQLDSDPAVTRQAKEGEDVHPHIERARAALAFLRGKPAEMDAILDKLFGRDKGDNDALLIRGYAKLASGDTIGASKAFDDVLKINPKNVDALLGHADVARRSQDRDGAASFIEQAEAATVDNARVKLARAELQLEDPEARTQGRVALEALAKAADSLGERDRARLHLAVARVDAQSGFAQKARAALKQAASEDETGPILRALAWQYVYGNEPDKAAETLQAASKADVDGGESFYIAKATLLLKQGMADKLTELAKLGSMKGIEKRATLYVNGLAQEAQKKNPAALKLFAASVKADKTFSWPVLAEVRLRAQKPKLKLVRLALLAKTAADAPALAAYADALFDEGQFKAAAERYEQALDKDPWATDLVAVSGRYMMALQKSGRTLEAAKIAIANQAVDPKDTKAVLAAATMAKNAGAYEEAQRLIERGLEEHPKDTALRILQAETLVLRGNRDKARSLLQQLLKDEEKNPAVHEAMARSYHPADPDLVKLHIKNAIALNPNEAGYHTLLGDSYFAKNKYDEAHDAYDRARELDPKNVDTLVQLSRVAELQGKKKESVERMRDALKLDPTRRTLVLELGERLEDMDQRGEALKLYQEALKREPNQSELLARVGRVYQSNGNRPLALKTYLLALKANPNDAQVQYRLGYLYKDAGQNKPAIKAFEAYLRLSPKAEDRKDIETEIADMRQ